ncbi:ABC transporter substrate-binding protein [Herbidospora galbida]|uniref:ABC transporter substrate-binding protein n=1 Tax=Herbidospora galbida TaxID=2575442 RepID=A0A4U3MHH9_9ACTN|nr:ABC transporter substrate-binding protein [Herbidospora galbida]TKK87824.1 ABC transporter substrate-binding protein [Herbidospora galbida]
MTPFRARFAPLVLISALALTGCSAPTATPSSPDDTFVLGISSEPDTLNPVLGYAPDGGSLLFDGLLGRDADLSLRPALADKLPETDGTTVTFTLRKDVTFHDGTPLTSEDVVHTYKAVLDEKNNSGIRGDFAAIESVEAPDPATVVFRLKYPYAAILQRATLGIVPVGRALDAEPVGTGPYTFVSRTPGDKLVLKANPSYWGGAPAIRQLVVAYAGDDNVRATRMAAGEFDATVLPPKAAARFENRQGLTVHKVQSADYRGVMFPFGQPVTGDLAIRKAVNLALDRQAMVDTILAGAGEPAFGPIAPGTTWHNPAVAGSATPDQAQATRLLDEAGWHVGDDGVRAKDGTRASFTLMYPAGDALRKDLALAVASDVKKIGVDVRLAGLDWDAIEPRMSKDALVMGYGAPFDPDYTNYELFHSAFAGQGFFNPGHYKAPEVDALLDEGREEPDPVVRKRTYDAFQQRISDDAAWAYLVYLKHVYVVRGEWSGIAPSVEPHAHDTGGLFRNLAEWKPAS